MRYKMKFMVGYFEILKVREMEDKYREGKIRGKRLELVGLCLRCKYAWCY